MSNRHRTRRSGATSALREERISRRSTDGCDARSTRVSTSPPSDGELDDLVPGGSARHPATPTHGTAPSPTRCSGPRKRVRHWEADLLEAADERAGRRRAEVYHLSGRAAPRRCSGAGGAVIRSTHRRSRRQPGTGMLR